MRAVTRVESYLKFMRLIQEHADQTVANRPSLTEETGGGLTAAQLGPAFQQARRSAHRTLATVRSLRMLIELNEQIQDDPDLDSLDLPESAKTDPVSGNRLIVRKQKDGWLIYGVGVDGRDDGGSFETDLDHGIRPESKK